MGAKTQIENKKLDVPAPGAYNIPDKVSGHCSLLMSIQRLLRAKEKRWERRLKSSSSQEFLDQVQEVIVLINQNKKTMHFQWEES